MKILKGWKGIGLMSLDLIISMFVILGISLWGVYIYLRTSDITMVDSTQCKANTISRLVLSISSIGLLLAVTIFMTIIGIYVDRFYFSIRIHSSEEKKHENRPCQLIFRCCSFMLWGVSIVSLIALASLTYSGECNARNNELFESVHSFIISQFVLCPLMCCAGCLGCCLPLIFSTLSNLIEEKHQDGYRALHF